MIRFIIAALLAVGALMRAFHGEWTEVLHSGLLAALFVQLEVVERDRDRLRALVARNPFYREERAS